MGTKLFSAYLADRAASTTGVSTVPGLNGAGSEVVAGAIGMADIRDWGVIPSDATKAQQNFSRLKTAYAAEKNIFWPALPFIADPIRNNDGDLTALIASLEGSVTFGFGATLKFSPDWVDAQSASEDIYRIMAFRTGSRVFGLTIDGDSDNTVTTGATALSCRGFLPFGDATDVIFSKLMVRNLPNVGGFEGFAYITQPGCSDILFEDCSSENIGGSGVSPFGFIENPAKNITVRGGTHRNCSWHSVANFGTDGVIIDGVRGFDGGQSGINNEYALNVHITKCHMEGHSFGGYTSLGASSGFIDDSTAKGNLQLDAGDAFGELSFRSAQYSFDATRRQLSKGWTIGPNMRVIPDSGKRHVAIAERDGGVNGVSDGVTVHTSIEFQGDASEWLPGTADPSRLDIVDNRWAHNVHFTGPKGKLVYAGRLSEFNASGGLTNGSYTGPTSNLSQFARTFTSTVQEGSARTINHLLKKGGKYWIEARVYPEDNAEWFLYGSDMARAIEDDTNAISIRPGLSGINEWYDVAMPYVVPADRDARIQITQKEAAAASHVLHGDYINIYEHLDNIHAFDFFNGMKRGTGAGPPSIGDFYTGDQFDDPAVAGDVYKHVITSKGTRGTLSSVTGQAVSGSPDIINVVNIASVKIGNILTMTTVLTRAEVIEISGTTITVDANASGDEAAGTAISYTAPVTKTISVV